MSKSGGRLMRPTIRHEMTPWRAVTLWGKEELEKMGYDVRLGHVSGERDTWYASCDSLGLELRCDGEDFRLCESRSGSRTVVYIYEYADPDCFDHCLADLKRYHERHRDRRRWPW